MLRSALHAFCNAAKQKYCKLSATSGRSQERRRSCSGDALLVLVCNEQLCIVFLSAWNLSIGSVTPSIPVPAFSTINKHMAE